MLPELKCIMLIDDDEDDNFFHEKEILDNNGADSVIVKNSAPKALDYLKAKTDPLPELIFLDINMPGMTGWEFLEQYNQMDKQVKSKAVIIMLSTSANRRDLEKAGTWNLVSDYLTKPLTREMLAKIKGKYFKDSSHNETA